MTKDLSNVEIKHRNESIFRSIQKKLDTDDEVAFLLALSKVKSFVERQEAYYPEARPIVRILTASLFRRPDTHEPLSRLSIFAK